MKLNKSEDHAQIFGDTEGRAYEQGGRYFRRDGSLWRDPNAKLSAADRAAIEAAEKEAAEAAAQAEAEAKAAAEAAGGDPQLNAQLGQT